MIGIVDYGMGNLRSVWNALDSQAIPARIVATAEDLGQAERLIIPGVGAFAHAMRQLNDRGLVAPIRARAAAGVPLLGICLGMQLLVSLGTETETTEGLDLIPGRADLLPVEPPQRLPHVGWNAITLAGRHPLFDGVRGSADFYFVHSFAVETADPHHLLARTEYGRPFASAIGRDNVVGVQFHPEKSQTNGLRILENFAAWDGRC
jgi:glutamine amidotransferase